MTADTRYFTVAEARELLADLMSTIDEFLIKRADLTEAAAEGEESDMPLADMKAYEARINEILESIAAQGVQVKGFAPLLLDFPMRHDGRELLLCWLEGEPALEWYHDAALGFAGRRRIDTLDLA